MEGARPDDVPSFKAFMVERDERFDGEKDGESHPGVFLGLGTPDEPPSVAFCGCGLCMAVAILQELFDSPGHAALALADQWQRR